MLEVAKQGSQRGRTAIPDWPRLKSCVDRVELMFKLRLSASDRSRKREHPTGFHLMNAKWFFANNSEYTILAINLILMTSIY